MFKPNRVWGKNFLSFHEFDIDVNKPGLWLVSGYNDKGGDSNGSGKSAILSAISMALWGRTSKGATSDIGNWEHPDWEVNLDMYNEVGDRYILTRTTNTTSLYINGQLITGHKRDIQNVIEDTFNSSYQIFINSTLWTQGKTEFLAASRDEDKKKLLKAILGLEVLDRGYENAKKSCDRITEEAGNIEVQIKLLEDRCARRQNILEDLRRKSDGWKQSTAERRSRLEAQLVASPKPGKNSNTELKELQTSFKETDYKGLSNSAEELASTLRSLYNAAAVLQSQIEDKERQITDLAKPGGICRQCGSAVTADGLNAYKRGISRETKDLKNQLQICQEKITDHESEKRQLDQQRKRCEEAKQKIKILEQATAYEDQRQKDYKIQVAKIKEDIKKLDSEENPTLGIIQSEEADLQKDTTNIATKQDYLKLLLHKIDVYTFLKWLLSKEGAPAYLIEQSFARLEQLTNVYMSRLCMEGYRIEIRPQRELKSRSGALKEEIDIRVLVDGKCLPYWNMSDGQRQRLNIALLIALHRLCKDKGVCPFDFLLLDEILDLSLGSRGQDDVMTCMRSLLTEVNSIFIISHKEQIADQFDHQIFVVRDREGISHVESQG